MYLSSNKINEKNIIVFLDDIGQLKSMNTTYTQIYIYIYIVLEKSIIFVDKEL